MSKVYLYAVFHGNLNFSYIPKDLYPQIVRRCYWPLLRIIEEQQVPLGLEFSAHTLQVVNSLDHTFVERLSRLWEEGRCEFVGSGYVQSIMPLVPARVNRENLRLGNAVYEELLGRRPSVAYINEQVYSAGLPRLYHEAGYKALVVNWESAAPAHENSELFYTPCAVSLGEFGRMPIIWHSLRAYRDFQQYVEGEIPLGTYLERLGGHVPETGSRAFPMYSSDWEVFDFKPWRVYPEGFRQPDLGEMDRIASLLALLQRREDLKFVTPSSLLTHFTEFPLVQPESASYPLPYKKQDVHSVARWAVGGRDNVRLNTQCHQLYEMLLQSEWHLKQDHTLGGAKEEIDALWKELCFLWNSDFRTFTTEEKYLEFRNRMGAALDRVKRLKAAAQPLPVAPGGLWLANCSPVAAESEPLSFTIGSNGSVPQDHQVYTLRFEGQTLPCQVTQRAVAGGDAGRLTLEVLPGLAADRAGTGTVRQVVPLSTPRSRAYRVDAEHHIVETGSVCLQLLPGRGGAIGWLKFPQVSAEPVIGGIKPNMPQAAQLGGHIYSGDLLLEDWLGRRVTDHHSAVLHYPEPDRSYELFLPIRCSVQTEIGPIWKTYRVYLHQPRVDLTLRFQWQDVVPKSFRVGRMILNPRVLDPSTLCYATANGSEDIERFMLQRQSVRHDELVQGGSTAQGCLGATEGWVVIADAARGIGFVTRPSLLYSVPMVHYEEMPGLPDNVLLTISYSLGEWDETSHTLWRGHSTWTLTILGGGTDVIQQTRSSALLSNGGLVARSATDTGFLGP